MIELEHGFSFLFYMPYSSHQLILLLSCLLFTSTLAIKSSTVIFLQFMKNIWEWKRLYNQLFLLAGKMFFYILQRRNKSSEIVICLKLVCHGMWNILKFSVFWPSCALSLFESESLPVSGSLATEKMLVHLQKNKNFTK